MSSEMHDLIKYNVAPKINKLLENSSVNNILYIRDKFIVKETKNKLQP